MLLWSPLPSAALANRALVPILDIDKSACPFPRFLLWARQSSSDTLPWSRQAFNSTECEYHHPSLTASRRNRRIAYYHCSNAFRCLPSWCSAVGFYSLEVLCYRSWSFISSAISACLPPLTTIPPAQRICDNPLLASRSPSISPPARRCRCRASWFSRAYCPTCAVKLSFPSPAPKSFYWAGQCNPDRNH